MRGRDSQQTLRKRAEEILGEAASGNCQTSDLKQLIYELEVHQVELEMQNDALRETHLELELSREKYRELFELAPVSYLTLNQNARVLDANYAAAALLGLPRDQIINKRFSSFVVESHAEVFARHRRQVFDGAARGSCELEIETEDGRRLEVRIESVRTSQTGVDWRMAIVDLTEVHRLERELQEARRLEALGTLSSGVAHDFNNLLMGVLGCADIALDRLPEHSDARASIALIRETVLRGRSVVAQLMTFARKGETTLEIVKLDDVIRGSELLLRRILGEGITLRLDLRAGDAGIRIDAGQLEQILLNLGSNSRHAMAGGGTFTIETFAVEDTTPAGPQNTLAPTNIRMQISDSGSGMDVDTLARAFEPFFTTKPPGVGTGLGLSMVYGAVQQAGGRIELDSRPGSGTRVSIDWPLTRPSARPSVAPRRPSKAPRRTRVLVVEDERLVRMAIRHYLEKAGYEVLEAGTGEEALALFDTQCEEVNVVVTDVVLPGIKGPQVAAAASARWPGLRSVLVSAHAPELLAERKLIHAGARVLGKPFTPEALCAEVEKCLEARASAAAVVTTISK